MTRADKPALRREAAAARRALPEDARQAASLRAAAHLRNSALWQGAKSLFCFVSIGDEINTAEIIRMAFEDGKRLYVPHVIKEKHEMLASPLKPGDELVLGAYAIPESPRAPEQNARVDLCVTPGLLFELHGFRLGYGGGYYDRFLMSRPETAAVGLCFAAQVSETPLPRDTFDRPCRWLLTENGLLGPLDGAVL